MFYKYLLENIEGVNTLLTGNKMVKLLTRVQPCIFIVIYILVPCVHTIQYTVTMTTWKETSFITQTKP